MKEVKYQRGFSKKPITQLNVVETHNMLLTLSGIQNIFIPIKLLQAYSDTEQMALFLFIRCPN